MLTLLLTFALAKDSFCLPPAVDSKPALPVFTEGKEGRRIFIENMAPLAVQIQELTGYPASITLAKLILETGGGTSKLSKERLNFAGLSCGYTTAKPDPKAVKPPDADDCWKAPSAPELATEIPEEPWAEDKFSADIWGGRKDLSVTSRCSNHRRTRTQVINGQEKVFFEGGRYQEFQHPFDSILKSVNNVLTKNSYNDPKASHVSGKTLGEKMKEWGVEHGVLESMKLYKTAKDPAEKAKRKKDILRILAGVYAPSRVDCKCCPESNERYDLKLEKLMESYDLGKYDSMKSCEKAPLAGPLIPGPTVPSPSGKTKNKTVK